MAHGPILVRGGRGSGKSALLIEAHHRLSKLASSVLSVYMSLRHLPLLRSRGQEYERIFCELLISNVQDVLQQRKVSGLDFYPKPEVGDLQRALVKLSAHLQSRIVLFFDDAAHLGRETALTEFFDIFRTLSSSSVSCKAAIYPGVTKFGVRFDVYNDATVLDITRDERDPNFAAFFRDVMSARYPSLVDSVQNSRVLTLDDVSAFLGRSVVGNMRAFVFACNKLSERDRVGFPEITECLLYLAADYYWPLLEELAPKLGSYEPLIEPSRSIAENIFRLAGPSRAVSVIVHRDLMQRFAKPLEILEYAGFISKREASRAMKSGGRGARFKLNLCNLLETTPGTRVTAEQKESWMSDQADAAEINKGSSVLDIKLPELPEVQDLAILSQDISSLVTSRAYPYGLTEHKLDVLKQAGINTVRVLAETPDAQLLALPSIGDAFLRRIRNVVGQAIWM